MQVRHPLLAEGGNVGHGGITFGGANSNDRDLSCLGILYRSWCGIKIGLQPSFQKITGHVIRTFVRYLGDRHFAIFAKGLRIGTIA